MHVTAWLERKLSSVGQKKEPTAPQLLNTVAALRSLRMVWRGLVCKFVGGILRTLCWFEANFSAERVSVRIKPRLDQVYFSFKGKDLGTTLGSTKDLLLCCATRVITNYHWYGTYWMTRQDLSMTRYFQRILIFFRLSGWVAFPSKGNFLRKGLIIRLFIILRMVFFYWSTGSVYKNWKSIKH